MLEYETGSKEEALAVLDNIKTVHCKTLTTEQLEWFADTYNVSTETVQDWYDNEV